MSIKILAIGDPHFKGEERRSQGNKIATDRLREEVIKRIDRHQPKIVVVLGDTLDRFSHAHIVAQTDAVNWFYEMAELVEEVFVLIGNHDRATADDFMSDYHPFTGIRNHQKIHIVSSTTSYYCKELKKYFLFVPWVPPGRFGEAVKLSNIDIRKVATIFAHQEFRGCMYREIVSTKGDAWSKSSPFVVSGHIHNYQRLGENILYVGTPMQHEFTVDDEKKSISLLTFNSGELTPIEKRLYLRVLEKRELEASLKQVRGRYLEFISDSSQHLIIWKIIVKGNRVDVDQFISSGKGKRLQRVGVLLFPRYITNRITEETRASSTLKNKVATFQACLLKRVGDDKLQLLWLEKISRMDRA